MNNASYRFGIYAECLDKDGQLCGFKLSEDILKFCDNVTKIPQEECKALVIFYYSTRGYSWSNNTNWLSTTTPCDWKGITCENSHVTEISRIQRNLIGNIPPEIGQLSKLESLLLGTPGDSSTDNHLNGRIPSQIGDLTKLKTLYLSGNELCGEIPESLINIDDSLFLGENHLSTTVSSDLNNFLTSKDPKWTQQTVSSKPCPVGIKVDNSHFCVTSDSTGNAEGFSFKLEDDTGSSVINLKNVANEHSIFDDAEAIAITLKSMINFYSSSVKATIQDDYCFTVENDGGSYTAPFHLFIGDYQQPLGELYQAGDSVSYNPTIKVLESSFYPNLFVEQISHDVPSQSNTITIEIVNTTGGSSTMGWMAGSTDSWLTIESGDYGENNGIITVRYDANSSEERTGTITVVAPGAENGSQTVGFKQEASPLSSWDGTIEGYKFIDSQINGTQGTFDDDIDDYLPNETIYLKLEGSSSRPSSRKTGDDGKYSFGQKNAGTYRVWQRSNPNSNAWTSYDNARIVIIAEDGGITVDDDQTVSSVDFPILGLTQADKDTVNQVKVELSTQCQSFTETNFTDADENDIVKIDSNLTITSPVIVKGICNNARLTVDNAISINATDFIANYESGSIVGTDGKSSSDNLPSFPIPAISENPADSNNSANNGNKGTTINIAVGTDTDYADDTNEWVACASTLQGTFYNEGVIQAGQGGSGYLTGGNGGEVRIGCAKTIIQSGEIIAGNGGEANGHQPEWDSRGGDGLSLWDGTLWNEDHTSRLPKFTDNTANYANISVTSGKGGQVLIHTGEDEGDTQDGQQLITTPTSKTISGEGGLAGIWCSTNPLQSGTCQLENWNDDDPRWPTGDCQCQSVNVATTTPGEGGDLNVYSKGSLKLQGKAVAGGSLYFEPSLMVSGKDTYIEAKEDVVIFGGENWELILTGLSEGAINAGRDIVLAVGEGGTIDLRGVSPKAFKAVGKFEIHANTVLLDEGVSLEDLIEAKDIVVGPSKILYHVILSGQQQVKGQPNTTVPISLTVANGGPNEDTYTLKAVSKSGWNVSGLPSSVSIKGLNDKQLALSIALPAEGNDTITITATSQADPTVVATMKVRAIVDLPEVVEPENVPPTAVLTITPETGEAPLTVALDGSASTDTDGTIASYKWTASDGQTVEGQNAQLTFNEVGDYTITLEVTDNDGAKNSVARNVKVEATGKYTASGTIRDELGNPIADVTVQIGDKNVVTDAVGNWEITGLPESDNYIVTASKDGYTFMDQDCAVGNNENCKVVFKIIPDLKMKVTASSRTVRQDDNLTYTITVINGGAEPATGVVLTDELPEGTSLVSFTALNGGECNADTLTCSLPDLTTGNFAKVELVMHNSQTKNLVNTATVTSNEYPTDVVKTRTRVIPHLSVSISDTPDPIAMAAVNGERILHYTITAELSPKAPSAATGIELLTTLPKGVEIQSINSDAAVCEINNPQTVTCQLKDLSVTNPEDISSVNVALDVKLNDAGLLVLTNETKVSANEYPAHTYRERTQVFVPPEYKVKLALVIDVTGSMEPEMNGVKRAILEVIEELKGQSAFPLSALVVFRDDVSVKAVTSDGTILTNAVERLKASQGGTCPEASAEALNKAIDHVEDGGSILFVTDASPYKDADIDALIERLLSHNIRVNVLMTGDCTNPDSWNKLPNAE